MTPSTKIEGPNPSKTKLALITTLKQILGGSNLIGESPPMGCENLHHRWFHRLAGVHYFLGELLKLFFAVPIVAASTSLSIEHAYKF
jgi:hypothetical protein